MTLCYTIRNTGDIAGDTSFVISRRTTAYDCRKNPSSFMCSGLAQFTGDNPDSTDLVLQCVSPPPRPLALLSAHSPREVGG